MITAADYDGTYNEMDSSQKDEIDLVITAENYTDFPNVEAEGNSNVPIFFNPSPKQDFLTILHHKAHILNLTGANRFYDDDKSLIPGLRLLCPKTQIIHFVPTDW